MMASRTYLSIRAPSTEVRAKLGGWTSIGYGVGVVFGPAMGGYLSSSLGNRAPAIGAAGLSLISLVTLLFLDNTTSEPVKEEAPIPKKSSSRPRAGSRA